MHLWAGVPCQRRASRPGKGRFDTSLPRDHGSEATVAGVPVAEEGKSPERRP